MTSGTGPAAEELLAEIARYPLLAALFGRRSRRFGRGMAIPDGPLAYASKLDPEPISELERALLVLCACGITGWNFGIEHVAGGDPEAGCSYPVRLGGRTFATGAGIGAAELIYSDDAGTFITRFRDLDAEAMREYRGLDDLARMLARGGRHAVKLFDGRLQVPAETPHTSTHNLWNANKPGSTLFVPVVDTTQRMLNLIAIYLARGFVPYDNLHQRDCGDMGPFVRAGIVSATGRYPLADFEQGALASGAAEQALMCQNIVLVLEAMGLGGWMYTGLNPTSMMGGRPNIPGLGFRFTRNADWALPNPVGIDGELEGFCPPYHADMAAAVDAFVALKYGPGGAWDTARGGAWRDTPGVKARAERWSPGFIDCMKAIATYIHDTYGKFPGTVPSMSARLIAQAHHLDLGFYDWAYEPGAYGESHLAHMRRWHGREE